MLCSASITRNPISFAPLTLVVKWLNGKWCHCWGQCENWQVFVVWECLPVFVALSISTWNQMDPVKAVRLIEIKPKLLYGLVILNKYKCSNVFFYTVREQLVIMCFQCPSTIHNQTYSTLIQLCIGSEFGLLISCIWEWKMQQTCNDSTNNHSETCSFLNHICNFLFRKC